MLLHKYRNARNNRVEIRMAAILITAVVASVARIGELIVSIPLYQKEAIVDTILLRPRTASDYTSLTKGWSLRNGAHQAFSLALRTDRFKGKATAEAPNKDPKTQFNGPIFRINEPHASP